MSRSPGSELCILTEQKYSPFVSSFSLHTCVVLHKKEKRGKSLRLRQNSGLFSRNMPKSQRFSLFTCFCDVEPVGAVAVWGGEAERAVDGRQVVVHTVQVSLCA